MREIFPTIMEKTYQTTGKDSETDTFNQEMSIPFTTDRSITFIGGDGGEMMMVGIDIPEVKE